MSFNTALSGLQAASLDLSNTSNNIANVSTTGFKYSRTEFGDVFSLSPFGNSSTAVGNGVQVDNVSQQFSQGNLEFTDASLDMAISGQGYFVVTEDRNGTNPVYSRAGEFGVDSDGFIVNNDGRFLQVFPVDSQGNITSISLNNTQSLQLPATTGAPQLTNEIEIGLNLDADKSGLNPGVFNPTQNTTYSNSTSASIFDSLGQAHVLSYYFIKDRAAVNQWQALAYLDGAPVDFTGGTAITHPNGVPPVNISQSAVQLNFDSSGEFIGSTPATIITALTLSNGAANMQLVHDFENNSTTQYSADFSVNTLNPNGFSTGRLTGLDVNEEGLVRALYSNGVSNPLGKIALGDFRNSQGLTSVGSSSWIESSDSGEVNAGEAGSGRFGLIQSGALETSNVDLTAQLVNLITAQRNFQANARSIETLNTLTQTIIQIR
ncbi:MAG: flagellar hook protein FlgE [Gammaproteobacteria bacterium]|nr:flagellar hook protein FlgE [Gammaproteobacteria bacterium]MBL6998433.1 flagellar hook protein FlgE [Gammaproteobacteria bacterium]